MTRCIHCTRCVRFLAEVGGSFDFGAFARGILMEIGNFIIKYFQNELFAMLLIYVL